VWAIKELEANVAAQPSWRKVIGAYIDGPYTERLDTGRGRIIQEFTVPPGRHAHPDPPAP